MRACIRLAGLAAILALASTPALAECRIGPAPTVPNGAKATEAEMTDAQAAVRAYVVETQEFLACLEAQARGQFTPDVTARYNDATDRMSNLALELNAQMRLHKARS